MNGEIEMEFLLVVMVVVGASLFIPGNQARAFLSRGRANRFLSGLIAVACVTGAAVGQAADTVETWDVGATDVDFYMGAESFGLPREDGTVFGDMMLGYGLIDRFSAYIGTTLQSDRTLGQSDPQHYFGLFGTPLATAHVDFDLFLNFSSSGSEATITPSFELNLDAEPDMSSFGFYLRAGVVFHNQPAGMRAAESQAAVGTSVEINPGVYWSLTDRSQLLLEFSTGFLPTPVSDEDKWEVGHLHLGYNHTLVEEIELITEVNWALEKIDDVTPIGAFMGIIVTLPSGKDET